MNDDVAAPGMDAGPAGRPANPLPSDEVRLARLHLRLGMLTIARAEFEDLERRSAISGDDRAALAEVRWRTGNPDGAIEAAAAHLGEGGDDPVAIAIAVEAAAAEGRPAEARALMQRLADLDAPAVEALFAGMPRRAHWPSQPGGPSPELSPPDDPSTSRDSGPRRGAPEQPSARPSVASRFVGSETRSVPGPREVLDATEPSLWSEARGARRSEIGAAEAPEAGSQRERDRPGTESARRSGAESEDGLAAQRSEKGPSRRVEHPEPLVELTLARRELASDPSRAFLRLGLVLRTDPTLATAVLDAIRLRKEPAAALLRGDAQRLLGRHLEAEAAFADAGVALAPDEEADTP